MQDYVRADDAYAGFLQGLKGMFDILLPRYRQEGKSYLTIAFGCTGEKHRSVTVTEEMAAYLTAKGYDIGLHHRELKTK